MPEIFQGGQVREQDFPLVDGKMDPAVEQAIVAKQVTGYRYAHAYWAGALDAGHRYFRDLAGDIFSPAEKEWYKEQDKELVVIPELVPKINALEGMQIAARRKGTVIASGPEDAPDASIIDHILREDIHRKNNLEMELTRSFTDGIVTSFPQAIWFDRADPDSQGKRLDVYHDLWDATIPDPKFTRMDYSDGQIVRRVRTMTREQLLIRYPSRSDRINEMLPEGSSYDSLSIASFTNRDGSKDRSEIVQKLEASMTTFAQDGLIYVIETMFFVTKNVTVWVSPKTTKVEILPLEWSQAEINRWKEFHPNYTAVKRDVRILWVTTVTPFGIVLENKPHWFQEGEFPCEFYIPRMWNNKIRGVVEFLSGSLRGRNITKIEHLHSLRLSNDNLMLVKQGALQNPKAAAREKGRAGGILVLKPLANMNDVSFPLNQRENLGWRDMSEAFLGDLDRLSVDRNFEGGTQSSQESGRAIAQRISQTQNKHLAYLTSFNMFNLRVNRKAVMMIPYLWTEPEIFRYVDPEHPDEGVKEVALNDPEEFSIMSGAATRIKNNLAGAHYDYVEVEGDNSPSAKEHEMLVFMDLLDHLGQIKEVELWPTLLASIPNAMAQKFGRLLEKRFDERAKASESREPDPAKVSLSIKGEQLMDPMAIDVLREMGVLPKPTADQPTAAQPPAAAAPGAEVPEGIPPELAAIFAGPPAG